MEFLGVIVRNSPFSSVKGGIYRVIAEVFCGAAVGDGCDGIR